MFIKAAISTLCEKMVKFRWLSCWTFIYTLCFSQRLVMADLDKTCTLDHRIRGNQGICGEKLSEILHFLCGARYNKRSIPDDVMPLDLPDVPNPGRPSTDIATPPIDENNNDIFLSKDQALSLLRRDVKRSARYLDVHGSGSGYRGIVCECCHHRCSIKELTQYCADPSTSLGARLGIIGKRSVRAHAPSSSSSNSGSLTRALLDLNRLWEINEQQEREYSSEQQRHGTSGDIQNDKMSAAAEKTGSFSDRDDVVSSKERFLIDLEDLL